jgi:hypothetical protein
VRIATQDDFAPTFWLLQQEGTLIEASLASGLTSIRTANPGHKGNYYSAFFQLSIGVERLLKVVLILDHMAANGLATPSRKVLRDFGHDLVDLHRQVAAAPSVAGALESPASGSVEEALLHFLSDFAKTTRYHNLDALTSSQAPIDPLAQYSQIFTRVLSEDVNRRKLQQINDTASGLAAITEAHLSVLGRDLDGRMISQQGAFQLGPLHSAGTPFVVLHLYALLQPIRTAMERSSDAAQMINHQVRPGIAAVPFMEEFLVFLTFDRATVLRKRRWP